MEMDKSTHSSNQHETSLQDELFGMNYAIDQGRQETEETHTQKIVSEGLTLEGASNTTEESANTSKSSGKDPDRPRYTLTELQKLLEERNVYKDKMISYAEELQFYKEG